MKRVSKIDDLPPVTRETFNVFLRHANKGGLHPYNWQRFYGFIATCRRFKVQLSEGDLAELLRGEGFQHAGHIAEVYRHGREILRRRYAVGPYR